jgi:predicted transcriptional regulator
MLELGGQMTRRRDRVSVVSSILSVCSGGATKSKIVRQANLNSITVGRYLENLKNKGLLVSMAV